MAEEHAEIVESVDPSEVQAEPEPRPGLLAGLGIHGWQEVEIPLLAGVMLGEPVLLVSEPGAAKTYFGEVISEALDLDYGYYDLGNVQFEDLLGLPIPAAMNEGREEYVETPKTVWRKQALMCDEVSRANRDMSNKFLEILGSRSLNGRPLPLRVVIGGMNPIEHQGTHPLDEAFADRFLMFIRLPEFSSMHEQTRKRILGGKTGLDAPSVDHWASDESKPEIVANERVYVLRSEEFEQAAAALRSVLRDAARVYRLMEGTVFAEQVGAYCDVLARWLGQGDQDSRLALEPRRLKMLKRSILASVAMKTAIDGEDLDLDDIIRTAGEVALMGLPHPHTGQMGYSEQKIKTAHARAKAALTNTVKELRILAARTHAEKIRLLLSEKHTNIMVADVAGGFLKDTSLEADMTSCLVAQLLMTDEIVDHLPVSAIDQLARRFVKTQEKMRSNVTLRLEFTPDIVERFEESKKLRELAVRASRTNLGAYALHWAMGQHPDNPIEVESAYEEALGQLIESANILMPILVKWGVDGADPNWDPQPLLEKMAAPATEEELRQSAAQAA